MNNHTLEVQGQPAVQLTRHSSRGVLVPDSRVPVTTADAGPVTEGTHWNVGGPDNEEACHETTYQGRQQ